MARQATVQDVLTGHDDREAHIFKCREFLNALNLYKTCMFMCQQCLFKIDHLYGSIDVFISKELQCSIYLLYTYTLFILLLGDGHSQISGIHDLKYVILL